MLIVSVIHPGICMRGDRRRKLCRLVDVGRLIVLAHLTAWMSGVYSAALEQVCRVGDARHAASASERLNIPAARKSPPGLLLGSFRFTATEYRVFMSNVVCFWRRLDAILFMYCFFARFWGKAEVMFR